MVTLLQSVACVSWYDGLVVHPIESELRALADAKKASVLARFFKTGPGQYGEGDMFLGLTVPQVRALVKKYAKQMSLTHIEALLDNPIHEVRLAGVLALVARYEKADFARQAEIVEFYLKNLAGVNNWDLVDSSAAKILGAHMAERKDASSLDKLAQSVDLWTQRVAIVATYAFIQRGIYEPTIHIASVLLMHPHDLIHKAVGWMLREVGKRDESVLRSFLDEHAAVMPRTMLRYALEKFPETDRQRYMGRRAEATT